jgi:hypothetical protein
MTTELLEPGTTAAVSAEQTIAAGESHTIILKPAAGKAGVPLIAALVIQLKSAEATFVDAETIMRSKAITGPLTYRLRRPAQIFEVGADVDV